MSLFELKMSLLYFSALFICLQAIKVKWYILGPFQCGMNEIDGIPLTNNSINSLNLPNYPSKNELKMRYYSELSNNGYVKWKKM